MAAEEKKLKLFVTYDVVSRYDNVKHKEETINAKSIKSLLTHLRIKNKNLGAVRNVSYAEIA